LPHWRGTFYAVFCVICFELAEWCHEDQPLVISPMLFLYSHLLKQFWYVGSKRSTCVRVFYGKGARIAHFVKWLEFHSWLHVLNGFWPHPSVLFTNGWLGYSFQNSWTWVIILGFLVKERLKFVMKIWKKTHSSLIFRLLLQMKWVVFLTVV
jgi:hypothetical protein